MKLISKPKNLIGNATQWRYLLVNCSDGQSYHFSNEKALQYMIDSNNITTYMLYDCYTNLVTIKNNKGVKDL